MSQQDREYYIQKQVATVSPVEAFETSTHQAKAMKWIIDEDEFYVCPDDSNLIQRYILTSFYMGASGGSWYRCGKNATITSCDGHPFLSPVHECKWNGIGCDSHSHVTSIDLSEHNVAGSIPSEFGFLENLVEIDLDSNHITGIIPSELGNLRYLEIIDIDHNQLTGTLPKQLFNTTSIRVLDLDNNMLTGIIPTQIGNLKNLYFVQLDFNPMSGPVPQELANAKGSIKYLSLFGIKFDSGSTIPSGLCNTNTTSSGITLYANCDVCGNDECCTACLET